MRERWTSWHFVGNTRSWTKLFEYISYFWVDDIIKRHTFEFTSLKVENGVKVNDSEDDIAIDSKDTAVLQFVPTTVGRVQFLNSNFFGSSMPNVYPVSNWTFLVLSPWRFRVKDWNQASKLPHPRVFLGCKCLFLTKRKKGVLCLTFSGGCFIT